MAITQIFARGFGFGSTGGTTSAIDTTGCDFLWAGIEGEIAGTTPTIVDSKLNTWHILTQSIGVGFTAANIWWCVPTSVGTGHTFTFTGASGAFPGCFISGYHGVDQSSPLDHDAGNPGTSSSSNTWTPGSAGCLVVALIANFTGNITAVASPLTLDVHQPLTGGTNYDGAIASVIQTTAISVTATFSGSLSGRQTVAAASFKAASSAVNIAIPLATMAITTYAPALATDIPVPAASLAFTTYAPSIGAVETIPIPLATLVLATFAPALSIDIPIPSATLGITTYAPQVSPIQVNVPAGSLVLTTYAPGVVIAASVEIPTGHLTLTTYAPIVVQANLGPCAERFGPKLYFWEPAFLDRPEDTEMRATDWEDAGLEGAKFLQGFTLEADTQGVDKVIKVQGDQADLQTYTINHNGQQIKPYVFDPTQIASLVRIISPDGVDWRYFGVRWIWEPVPELVTYYETQGTTHDLSGYQFLKDGYIALISIADVTFTINVDGVNFVYTIPSTGGLYKKNYVLFGINGSTGQTLKGKLYTYILESSAGFRLFQKDCEVRVHSWGGGGYQVRQPFGETSRVYGARI